MRMRHVRPCHSETKAEGLIQEQTLLMTEPKYELCKISLK